MRTLLRLQGLVLRRQLQTRAAFVVALPIGIVAMTMFALGVLRGQLAYATPLVIGLIGPMGYGMVTTLDAMEPFRWQAPFRGRALLAAHYAFWGAASLGFAVLLGGVHARSSETGGAPAAMLAFTLGIALASLTAFLRSVQRRPTAANVITLVILGGGVVQAAFFAGLLWALGEGGGDFGPFPSILLLPGTILSALFGAWFYLHEEASPSGADVAVAERRSGPASCPPSLGPSGVRALPPAFSVARAGLNWWPRGILLLFTLIVSAFPGTPDYIWFLFACNHSNLALPGATAAWRWLSTTPMARKRAFLLVFAPVLITVALAGAIRTVTVARDPDTGWTSRDRWALYSDSMRTSDGRFDPRRLADIAAARLEIRYGLSGVESRVHAAVFGSSQRDRVAGGDVVVPIRESEAVDRVLSEFEEDVRSVRLRWTAVFALAAVTLVLMQVWGTCGGRWIGIAVPLILVLLLSALTFASEFDQPVWNSIRCVASTALTEHPVLLGAVLVLSAALALRMALSAFRRWEVCTATLPKERGSGGDS